MDKALWLVDDFLPQILAQRTGCQRTTNPFQAWIDSVRSDWDEVEPGKARRP